jgi:hypothetical protein
MRASSALAVLFTLSSLPAALSHGANLLDVGCGRVKRDQSLQRRQTAAGGGGGSGEGATSDSPGGASAAGYSCDPNTCKAPNCMCASTKPPGGLSLSDVPQFITLTADDAIQSYTIDALNSLVNGRKNPNGCNVSTTYFTSLDYTNYSMVTDYFVAGNEVADHTITHVGVPSIAEMGILRESVVDQDPLTMTAAAHDRYPEISLP